MAATDTLTPLPATGAASALDRLFAGKTVLCDGAMGTMLYSCGVFINRCYDELNVTEPELVRSVHAQYLLAGAELIETNTFGANAIRLEHFGCVTGSATSTGPGRPWRGKAWRPTAKSRGPTPLSRVRSARWG